MSFSKEEYIYQDHASGKRDDRPGLKNCLKALREGDTLIVWKLDRLGRDLHHLVNTVHDLAAKGIGLKVLTGHGAAIDTTTAAGKLVFGIFAALSEFEREMIKERTLAGMAFGLLKMQMDLLHLIYFCSNLFINLMACLNSDWLISIGTHE